MEYVGLIYSEDTGKLKSVGLTKLELEGTGAVGFELVDRCSEDTVARLVLVLVLILVSSLAVPVQLNWQG